MSALEMTKLMEEKAAQVSVFGKPFVFEQHYFIYFL